VGILRVKVSSLGSIENWRQNSSSCLNCSTSASLVAVACWEEPPFKCCELRTPPALRTFDDSSHRPLLGVDVRFFWHERTSTFVQFEASAERAFQFTYSRPASPPVPFLTYEAERRVSSRHQTWTVGQTYELGAAGAVRPWLFGALGRRLFAETQESLLVRVTDATVRQEAVSEWHRAQWRVYAGAGMRVHVGRRLFVGGEVGVGWGLSQRCTDCHPLVHVDALEKHRSIGLRSMAGVRF
jgi:hypothetical protein